MRQQRIPVMLSERERSLLEQARMASGYSSLAEFIRVSALQAATLLTARRARLSRPAQAPLRASKHTPNSGAHPHDSAGSGDHEAVNACSGEVA